MWLYLYLQTKATFRNSNTKKRDVATQMNFLLGSPSMTPPSFMAVQNVWFCSGKKWHELVCAFPSLMYNTSKIELKGEKNKHSPTLIETSTVPLDKPFVWCLLQDTAEQAPHLRHDKLLQSAWCPAHASMPTPSWSRTALDLRSHSSTPQLWCDAVCAWTPTWGMNDRTK